MKYFALAFSFTLLLLILNCSQEPVSPGIEDQISGKLFLKIDKENAPESVVWVEAFLTRAGYDTISGTLNLLSDSTADLLLEEIQSGEWHLKVDAKDSTQVVLYTGETDVQIFAGFTTQVNLVLQPTGAGTGNIYIWVTWGVPYSGNWIDFNGNPILTSTGSYWDYSSVAQPRVLIENNVFKMYYTAQGSPYSGYIGLAYSNDGVNWSIDQNSPVLIPGAPGSWDDLAVAAATVIKDSIGYKLYYHGWSDPYEPWHIGLATSMDGINWSKYPTPVLYASSGMEFQLAPSAVLMIDDIYYMYYSGMNNSYSDIRLATSIDGITWTKYSGNPILSKDENWEGTGIYYPSVLKIDNQFVMIFMDRMGTGFGRAVSSDGINWQKSENNPFFTKYNTYNNWGIGKISYPNFIKINNQERVYYSAFRNNPPFEIGFVSR